MFADKRMKKKEILSEDVQDIMGQMPSWIVRWGITVIAFVIFLLIAGSFLFKYPDILKASATIVTENPPVELKSKLNTKIQEIFVHDSQTVDSGQWLMILENPANYHHVKNLRALLSYYDSLFLDSFQQDIFLQDSVNLGEFQQSYNAFVKSIRDLSQFQNLDYYQKRIEAVRKQLNRYLILLNQNDRKRRLLEEELKIQSKQFRRDQILFEKKTISEKEFEESERKYLQKKYTCEEIKSENAAIRIQISELEESIMDMGLQENNKKNEFRSNYEESLNKLKADLSIWLHTYVLQAPVKGQVAFTRYWKKNQNVQANESVLAFIPEGNNKILARLEIPAKGSGKVLQGQKVNIRLHNYPYMEYGMLQGIVSKISLVPVEQIYVVEVELPDGLQTNYGEKLKFHQNMEGLGEIITEDKRLIERMLNPFRFLFEKYAGGR
jgi:multidrug resistance efflux pump